MIKVENGELSVQGNISTLYAELTSAFKGITEGLHEDDYPRDLVAHHVKGYLFLVEDVCKEMNLDITITDEDRKAFEEAKDKSGDKAERMKKALLDLLNLLKSASDDDDVADDTEDDIPDFLF